MNGLAASMGQKTGINRIFVGKLGSVKCRWDYDDYNGGYVNNRIDLKESGGKVWNGLIYFRTATSGGHLSI